MAQGKTAVVAGGTGGIGEGIVKALIDGGWNVYVPARGSDKVERLKTYVGVGATERLHPVTVDLSSMSEVAAFRKQVVAAAGSVDLVVVSVGSSYYGYSLHKIPEQDWDRILTENLSTHFHLQHEFLSLFHAQDKGVYVTLTGPEADFAHPETGLMSILASAQKMMARVEAMETQGTDVRVYSVTSKSPIATRARGEQCEPGWIHPDELGLYVKALAEKGVPGTGEALHTLETRDQLQRLLKLQLAHA